MGKSCFAGTPPAIRHDELLGTLLVLDNTIHWLKDKGSTAASAPLLAVLRRSYRQIARVEAVTTGREATVDEYALAVLGNMENSLEQLRNVLDASLDDNTVDTDLWADMAAITEDLGLVCSQLFEYITGHR